MNSGLKLGLMSVAAGLALQAGNADAAVAQHLFRANAVNYCQAFTPGPANTIRNRVVGSENVGATMNVACNFHTLTNGAAGVTPPTSLTVYFANNNASGSLTVTCALLTGYQGQGSSYIVTKTTGAINAGGVSQAFLTWNAADNPVQPATNLGNYFIGINCTLPTGAVINDTYLYWNMDNGV